MVSPEIDDNIDIVIEDKDLRIDTYRASGAGGQHVNKTESAIRVTHLPTGIAVKCQTSRAQSHNRELALKTLKSKLLAIEMQKKKERDDASLSSKDDISWGNQIRNYVFHPYRLIKDVRSNFSSANIDKILNGDLDEMIKSVLLTKSL
jgi:peptide chain release factor 2